MSRKLTTVLIWCMVLVLILACGVKLPTGGEGVNTATATAIEADDAMFSLRDVPTVTPIPAPVLNSRGEKGLP